MIGPKDIVKRTRDLRSSSTHKEKYMDEILALREGRWEEVMPGILPEGFEKPFVANMIDIAAKDTSETIAPLPAFSCFSANMTSDRARTFADKRTKIANYYVDCSNLQVQMFAGADRLLTYGYIAFMVEPDFDEQMPKIRIDNTFKSYYKQDPFGRHTLYYARCFKRDLDELILEYPDVAAQLGNLRPYGSESKEIELILWYDRDQMALVTMDGAILLRSVKNRLSRCPVRVVEMPKLGDVVRGQYDDAIGVQIARVLAQSYILQGMDESVNAPIAVPNDVQTLAMGSKEIIRSENPQAIGRVNLQIPQAAFAEAQNLTAETRLATRYPEGRSGQIDASIITGQGVEALMGSFTTQKATANLMLAAGLKDVLELCFEADDKYFNRVQKTVTGNSAGTPYEVTYTPAKDIKGSYQCEVTYGLAGGLDPNRAGVLILQLQAAGLISDDTAMRQLPVDIAVEDEKKQIAVELLRKSLSQAMAGYAQAIPMMATQGMDPAGPVQQIAEIVRLVQKGEAIEEVVAKVLAPPPPPPAPEGEAPPGPGGAPAEQGLFNEQTGLPPGIAEGQAGMGAGGAQDLLMSLVGLTGGGAPQLQSTVSRRQPA